MNFIIHRTVMAFIFLAGLVCFLFYSFNQNFFLGAILISLSLLFVNLYGFLTNALLQKHIFYLFSLFMFFMAISVFCNYGVEQKPIGYQTLYNFNLEGIAISLMLCLLSSLLLIIGIGQKTQTPLARPVIKKAVNLYKTKKREQVKPKNIIESDDWQEASLEDIKSGKYQAL